MTVICHVCDGSHLAQALHFGSLASPTSHYDLQNDEPPFLQHTRHWYHPVPHPRQPAERQIAAPDPAPTYVTQPAARENHLPPGFKLRFNPQGLPFYVDHNTRTKHLTLRSAATVPHNLSPTQAVVGAWEVFHLG